MTMKELFAPSDMTVGKPWEKIVAFTIPMLIGNIAQQLYNTVDSIVIGKYVGDNALAAVGSASPILNLLLVLFVGISVGAGVMVPQSPVSIILMPKAESLSSRKALPSATFCLPMRSTVQRRRRRAAFSSAWLSARSPWTV